MCLPCSEQHHISECTKMVQERDITPPKSEPICFDQRIETLRTEMYTLIESGISMDDKTVIEKARECMELKEQITGTLRYLG
jgi:hypothetical protein